jgi:hypothetical protein
VNALPPEGAPAAGFALTGRTRRIGGRRMTIPRNARGRRCWRVLAYPPCVIDLTWPGNSDVSPVIRADFAHEDEWTRVQVAITEPQTEDEFTANVEFIDDKAFDGLTAARLLEIVPADTGHSFAFLVDMQTLTHPDRPILVVNLYDWAEGLEDQGEGPQYGATFRVVPSEMWSVQNNLSLANMDWEEFADNVDDDGIFRGFD